MQFTEPIQTSDAVITAISHRIKEGVVTSRIQVQCTLDTTLARELEAKSLVFAHNDTPKEGFLRLELSTSCQAFRAIFEADPALKQSFEINGDSADNFVIERGSEGKLRLKFRLNYHGDPYMPLAYVLQVGSGESTFRLSPLQRELDSVDQANVEIVTTDRRTGQQTVIPVAPSDVRKAVMAAGKGTRSVQ